MAPGTAGSPYREWVSATDLAEYAYCPRAWYYRTHLDPAARTEESRRTALAGDRYHARALDHDWRQEQHLGAYLGLLLLGAGILVGGLLWIFW